MLHRILGSESITQWLLVAMSFERLLALYYPFRARFWGTGRHALRVCIIVLLLASPVLATASKEHSNVMSKTCFEFKILPIENATFRLEPIYVRPVKNVNYSYCLKQSNA